MMFRVSCNVQCGMNVLVVYRFVPFFFFLQGMTIKPLVRILHVKLRGKEQRSMYAELNEKVHTC